MKDDVSKGSRGVFLFSILLMFLSAYAASLIQSDFGQVTVRDLRLETEEGRTLSALLFIPDSAGEDRPAPAVVLSHGWFNSREMQDANYVELARRGFVVLSIDMYGHGGSEAVEEGTWFDEGMAANGLYDGVKYLAGLDLVDRDRIGISGHSNGALACNEAVRIDRQTDDPKIASVFLVSNDAFYTEEGEETSPSDPHLPPGNYYGDRDVGILSSDYDEFFFRVQEREGRPAYSAPRDFIHRDTAQSFLNFGRPAETGQLRKAHVYYESPDLHGALRIIHPVFSIHPWTHFSATATSYLVDFFDHSLGAPKAIPSEDRIWPWKAACNALGLLGFFIFFTQILLLLSRLRFFRPVRIDLTEFGQGRKPLTEEGIRRLKRASLLIALFSCLYFYLNSWTAFAKPPIFKQLGPFILGVWSLVVGLFILVILGPRKGEGALLPGLFAGLRGKVLLKSALVALAGFLISYSTVFLADYFLLVDFRFWLVTIRAFEWHKLPHLITYLPFFLVFYLAFAGYSKLMADRLLIGKSDLIQALVLSAPLLILIVAVYLVFFITGYLPQELVGMPTAGGILAIWLIPSSFNMLVANLIFRKLDRATGNPVLAGTALALLVTTINVTNTLTVL